MLHATGHVLDRPYSWRGPLGPGGPAGRRSTPRAFVVPRPCHGRSGAAASSGNGGRLPTSSISSTRSFCCCDRDLAPERCSTVPAALPTSTRESSSRPVTLNPCPRWPRSAAVLPSCRLPSIQRPKRSAPSALRCFPRYVGLDRLGPSTVSDCACDELHRWAGATYQSQLPRARVRAPGAPGAATEGAFTPSSARWATLRSVHRRPRCHEKSKFHAEHRRVVLPHEHVYTLDVAPGSFAG